MNEPLAKETIDRAVEIERLANLEPLDYDAARVKEAARLGVRAETLDKAVAKTRRALRLDDGGDDGQGQAVKLIDLLPWHEPVDGAELASLLAGSVNNYAVVPGVVADAIALWIMHRLLPRKRKAPSASASSAAVRSVVNGKTSLRVSDTASLHKLAISASIV